MKKKEERLEKEMAEVQLQRKRLTEPLQKAKEDVAELQKKLANYEKDKASLAVGHVQQLVLLLCSLSQWHVFLKKSATSRRKMRTNL